MYLKRVRSEYKGKVREYVRIIESYRMIQKDKLILKEWSKVFY